MDKDKALSKAKIGIIRDGSKFLSTITFSMKHIWDETIPTAITNGKTVKYNPDFFLSLTPEERVFLIAHESWHIALTHLTRLGNRDPQLYNQAGDYVINQILVDANFIMPTLADGTKIGLQDSKYRGMCTEQVYELLEKESPEKQPSSIMDGDIEQAESEEEQKEIEELVKQTIVKAIARSKIDKEEPGIVPAEVSRLIDELINPKLPWQQILERFLTDTIKADYTWKKPNKRFFPDFILPSQSSATLGHIAIAIDTSGSLSQKDLTEILSEIRHIHRIFKPEKLTILGCDYNIHNVYTISANEKIENLDFKGGGGTRFEPVFDYFEKSSPKGLIYFTDLYAKPITEKPKYPVIWICNSNHEPAEIGQTIYLKK